MYQLSVRKYVPFFVVLLIGCATQPLYSPAEDSESVGYYESRLTKDRYRVTFNGRPGTPRETVKNYALLRAAELTVGEGQDWFQIVDREDDNSTADRDTPRVSVSVGVGSGPVSRCYPFGCRSYGGPYYSGVGLHTTEYRGGHQSVIEIVMGTGEPQDPTKVYNAAELIKYLNGELE